MAELCLIYTSSLTTQQTQLFELVWTGVCLQAFYVGHLSLGEFLTSRRLWPFTRQCDSWFFSEFCSMAVWHMFYGPSDQVTVDDRAIIRNTWPATVATRNIAHWAQVGQPVKLQPVKPRTPCCQGLACVLEPSCAVSM